MKAKTEEFLYFLLWTCDRLTHPTFRNLTESFEGWAYRNGLHTRPLAALDGVTVKIARFAKGSESRGT